MASGVQATAPVPALETMITEALSQRADGLNEAQEAFRGSVRDVFRNGKWKPTGRSKPASEYLLRWASENRFPRINTLVDTCNVLSMGSMYPISVWDLDLAETDTFEFRLGAVDECYVFNAGGQEIAVTDLIVGCAMTAQVSKAIVNAVKDSQQTKTTDATSRVGVAVYAPAEDGPDASLESVLSRFEQVLRSTHPAATTSSAVLATGESIEFELQAP